MNNKTIKVLEFDKIREQAKKYAITLGGKEMIGSLKPYPSLYEVKKALKETTEGYELLTKKGNPPFEGLYDVREFLERAKKGGILSMGQLLYIGNMLRCTEKLKEYLHRGEDEEIFEILEDFRDILTPLKTLDRKSVV